MLQHRVLLRPTSKATLPILLLQELPIALLALALIQLSALPRQIVPQMLKQVRGAVPHLLSALEDLSLGKEVVLPQIVHHKIARRKVR